MVFAQMPVVRSDADVSTRLPFGIDTRPAVAGMAARVSGQQAGGESSQDGPCEGRCAVEGEMTWRVSNDHSPFSYTTSTSLFYYTAQGGA